jgi:hypothetical protein
MSTSAPEIHNNPGGLSASRRPGRPGRQPRCPRSRAPLSRPRAALAAGGRAARPREASAEEARIEAGYVVHEAAVAHVHGARRCGRPNDDRSLQLPGERLARPTMAMGSCMASSRAARRADYCTAWARNGSGHWASRRARKTLSGSGSGWGPDASLELAMGKQVPGRRQEGRGPLCAPRIGAPVPAETTQRSVSEVLDASCGPRLPRTLQVKRSRASVPDTMQTCPWLPCPVAHLRSSVVPSCAARSCSA